MVGWTAFFFFLILSNFFSYIRTCTQYAQLASTGFSQLNIPRISNEAIVVPTGNTDRVLYGLKLLKERNSDWILITGGSYPPLNLPELITETWGKDADVQKIQSKILLEPDAQTTFENARFSAPILKEKEIKRVILVTTDVYVPRALTIFKSFMNTVEIQTFSTPSGFSKLSFDLSDRSINGISLRAREYLKGLAYQVFALAT